MKKPLNYLICYKIELSNNSHQLIDETYFSKKSMLTRYLDILDGCKIFPFSGPGSICELSIKQAFKTGPIEDITDKINKFISN